MANPARPNLLLIMTDQQCGYAMSCAGSENVHTPAMDSLAQHGVRFERAYCPFPLCVPSRASMVSGRMPHEIEVMGNIHPLPEGIFDRGLGHLLSEAGYRCAWGGKWHCPGIAIQDGEAGFERVAGFDDNSLVEPCVRFLNEQHDKPFFLCASFDNPHNICEWARGQKLPWVDLPRPELADCPPLPRNFAIPPEEPEQIRAEQHNGQKGIYPGVRFSDEQWRRYRQAYFRLVEAVDAHIGALLQGLEDSGHAENTVVVFLSDHGDGMGAHHWNQKWVMYEESIRVPLIVSGPNRTRAGITDREHLVNIGLDLLPTLADYAEVDGSKLPDSGGRSVRPLAEASDGLTEPWRDELVVQTHWAPAQGFSGTQARVLITGRHKYVCHNRGQNPEQLFDLQNDPGEMVNLVSSRRHESVLRAHRARLARWLDEHGDGFVWPNEVRCALNPT